jgi:ribosomal protein S21
MASSRVRVQLREKTPARTKEEKDKAFRALFGAFKRQVNELGIVSEYKRREHFESPGEKRRRKRKESQRERAKHKSKRDRY